MTPIFRVRHVNSGQELLGVVVSTDGPLLTVRCWFRGEAKRFCLVFEESTGWQRLDARYGGGRGGWRLDKTSELAVSEEPGPESEGHGLSAAAREALN